MQFRKCTLLVNAHFLNCTEFHSQDVRFLGTTLWTDYAAFGQDKLSQAMHASTDAMMDHKRIKLEKTGTFITCEDALAIHYAEKTWLNKKLDEPFQGKTVVVTHMAPSVKSIAPKYQNDLASASFASDLEDLVSKASLWIHGHTHESYDYLIGKCRVVCNPCGYINRSGGTENFSFSPNLIVEI